MDLAAFVQSLTPKEKLDLFLLLKREYHPNEPQTVREFFEYHNESDQMTTRLRTAYREAIHQYRDFPEQSCLNKFVTEVEFEDLYRWRGMGKKTWEDFVILRGY